ncbi:MAG: diaminopimelate epimerase [Sumerlaeia bacterium]
MSFEFSKYQGAGNDFVVIDDRRRTFPADRAERTATIRFLCDRRRGIGADGLMLLQAPNDPAHHFRMEYFNGDGSEAEMCGNGARCICAYAQFMGAASGAMTFETGAGIYRAEAIEPERIRVFFPDMQPAILNVDLETEGQRWHGHFLTAGVPHLVLPVDGGEIEGIDVARHGRALRFHPRFAPAGTNVNFCALQDDGSMRLRTYERGVEGETLACGTGAVATTISHALLTQSREADLILRPNLNDTLRVGVRFTDSQAISGIFLEGPATRVYSGKTA